MENVALILAGGIGSRMNSDIPKQFIKINDRELIIYTIENMLDSGEIAKVYISCVDNYKNYLEELLKKYNLNNVIVISGGKNGFYSTYNGIKAIANDYLECNILINDANRPFVYKEDISNAILCCNKNGNAVTAVQSTEIIAYSENNISSNKVIQRENCYMLKKPECYRLTEILNLYNQAIIDKNDNVVATCDLYVKYNKMIYFINGSSKNFKVTYPEDIELARKILVRKREKN